MNWIYKGLFACALLGAAAVASADEVELIGSADGVFNNGLSSIDGLSYTDSTFDVTTFGGFYALGADAESPNFNNLGSFTLNGDPDNYTGDTFTLTVTFDDPAGISGSNSADFTATLFGRVVSNNHGGIQISFESITDTFNFNNSQAYGSFDFTVNPTSITPGHVVPVTGYGFGQMTAVPGPDSMIPFGLGLVGLVRKRSRRSR